MCIVQYLSGQNENFLQNERMRKRARGNFDFLDRFSFFAVVSSFIQSI